LRDKELCETKRRARQRGVRDKEDDTGRVTGEAGKKEPETREVVGAEEEL